MKFKYLLPFMLLPLLFSGCKNKTSSNVNPLPDDSEEEDPNKVEIVVHGFYTREGLKVQIGYDDSYYAKSAAKFNKKVMKISYGVSMLSGWLSELTTYFETMGFDNITGDPSYITPEGTDTIRYSFAHKHIEDFDLIAVTVNGMNYNLEWVNNFRVGESNNHYGFDSSANTVLEGLTNYINDNSYSNCKFVVTGYSRGGGVANVLASKLMQSDTLSVTKDNLFAYTFEAPRGLCRENAQKYENVYNILNRGDIVPQVAPEAFGMYRCGIDVDLYDPKIDEYIKALDPDIPLPSFKKDVNKYNNDAEFVSYILRLLTTDDPERYDEESYPYNFTDREHYQLIEPYLTYLLEKILYMDDFTTAIEKISTMSTTEIIALLGNDGENLYEFLKEVFDESEVSYDDEILREASRVTQKLGKRYFTVLTLAAMQSENMQRVLSMHCPEFLYTFIENHKF